MAGLSVKSDAISGSNGNASKRGLKTCTRTVVREDGCLNNGQPPTRSYILKNDHLEPIITSISKSGMQILFS